MSRTSDALIIGGGIIGASIAFHLLEKDRRLRVTLLEKEAETGTGSTSKATGGVRFQFSTETNVRLTQLSYRYFTHAEELLGRSVDFTRHGYLFVTTDPAILEQSKKSVALQQSLGVRSEVLEPAQIQRHLAALVTSDLLGGTFCGDDGSADPYGMLQGFLAIAKSRGLEVLIEQPVVGIERDGDRVTGVRTPGEIFTAPVVVNCAGPYADQVGVLAGVEIPSKPYRRQVMVTDPLPTLPEVFPLIVDLDTGFYVHRQGRSAVHLTPDYHGILGPARQAPGFYVACGFSGHGFMHAPAIGILMSEIVLDGRAGSMDIGALSLDRFGAGRLRAEANMF